MHDLIILILTISFFSFSLQAKEKGHIGFAIDVSVSGFFSPELKSVNIKNVTANSPADLAGIKKGQKILSIDGCEIPGCPADKAKKLMSRKSGEILPLLIEKLDGEKVLIKIHVE